MSVEAAEVTAWPSVRDVSVQLGVSITQVHRLLEAGRLSGVQTRAGWLVMPGTVTAYDAWRQARKAGKPT